MVTQLNSFRGLVDDYDAFLIDAWGVLHDGVKPYAGAIDVLRELKHAEKTVVIISNAARRTEQVALEMQRLGLAPDLYAHLATSGEAAWQALSARADDQHRALGKRCYYLGPDRSRNLMVGLNLDEVEQIEDASFLLVTGVLDPAHDLESCRTVLDKALKHNLVLVSANSDRIAISGGKTYFCGGAVAGLYSSMGGSSLHYGKPYLPIYETCFAALPGVSKERILAVGDSFETDMPGAKAANLDALFIGGGIHRDVLKNNSSGGVQALCNKYGCTPKAVLDVLRW